MTSQEPELSNAQLVVWEKLLNMGFDETIALATVQKHGANTDLEQCLTSILPSTSHPCNPSPPPPPPPAPAPQVSFLEWTTRCEQVLHFLASYKAAGTVRDHGFIDQCTQHCLDLFRKDGDVVVIDNLGSQELCDSYPIKLVLYKSFIERMERKHKHRRGNNTDNTINNNSAGNANINGKIIDYEYLCNLLETARFARVHRRFIAPVIFLPNHVCIARSSTLSTTGELLLNKASSVVSDALNYCPNTTASPMGHDLNALRAADIDLLRYFEIKFICDLMVEDKKKVGWGRYALTVTSSEKVDREQRYKAFHLSSMPYPGCEFFRAYKDNHHNATNLVFEWNDDIHDAKLNLHWFRDADAAADDDGLTHAHVHDAKGIAIEWSHYKQWDIVQLTQNYLRLILDHVKQSLHDDDDDDDDKAAAGFGGILVHCISGWDRTPLFICLLRLSLWADGLIHAELDSAEILYLTLCYDWLLFTHQFGNRLLRGEHILHFTFYMLQYLMSDQYSVVRSTDGVDDEVDVGADAARDSRCQPAQPPPPLKVQATKLVDHHGNICQPKNDRRTHKFLHKMKRFGQLTKSQTKKLVHSKSSSIFHPHSQLHSHSQSHHARSNSITKNSAQKQKSDDKNDLKEEKTTKPLPNPFSVVDKIQSPPQSHPIPVPNAAISALRIATNTSSSQSTSHNTSRSWELKTCAPLTNNIRHSYIPTMRTPPTFAKSCMTSPAAAQLQWVKTQPMITRRQQTPPHHLNACASSTQVQSKNFKVGSWQFVDNKNDSSSPMFQIISTPKSQGRGSGPAPPELKLDKHTNSDRDALIHTPSSIQSQSSSSCEDMKLRNKFSLSAPSSTKKYDTRLVNFKPGFVSSSAKNASPSLPSLSEHEPEMVAHPETRVEDIHERDLSESHSLVETMGNEPHEDIAKALVDDLIHTVVSDMAHEPMDELPEECTSLRLMGGMHGTKSTPVTISDYLGLESKVSKQNKVHSFEIMTEDDENCPAAEPTPEVKIDCDADSKPAATPMMKDNGRLIGSTRSEKLMQVYTLFNKVYTQVMIINDPPIFYKQAMHNNNMANGTQTPPNADDMDFVSTEKYASQLDNAQSEPYTQIANYLKSILPASFMGNGATASRSTTLQHNK